MTTAFSPRMVAPEEGKTVMLFGVRFSYKVESTHSGGSLEHRTPPEYYELAERYGITIQDDWIKDLEATYGVKL